MTFSDVVARVWRENRLFSVLLELTYRCNLDCFFCYNDVHLRGRALALDDYRKLLSDLAELGVLQLSLSGGEPLAHPHFFEIGRAARDSGFVVRVKSNGHALRGALARRLRDEVEPFLVEVSLHGSTAATHDRQTRVPGSFDRLLANLEEMKALGIRLKINSTLTAWNENEVAEMFAIADRLEMSLQMDPDVTPKDDGDREPLSIAPSREGVRRLFELEMERSGAVSAGTDGAVAAEPEVLRQGDSGVRPPTGGKHCGAGSSNLAIDPYGNVYPCVQWRRAVGNLHERSIGEIWATSAGLGEVRDLQLAITERLRAEGPDAHLLNFCPGAAEMRTGDATTPYDAGILRRELLREVQDERSDPERRKSRVLLPVVS